MEPFSTQNRQLAFALATAGCRFQSQEEDGPAINLYTIPFLRSRKIGVGKSLEAAAKEAYDRGIPGIVTYLFVRDETFERAIKAWDVTVEELQKADAQNRSPILDDIPAETVMKVLCIYANNLRKLAEVPFIRSPLVGIFDAETKEVPIANKPGPRRVTTGKGKIWSLGASQETKKKLKV